jgi:hypothetical protein
MAEAEVKATLNKSILALFGGRHLTCAAATPTFSALP